MARINLLPWRAERRKQRQKEFGLMLGLAAAAAIGVSLLISTYYDAQIEGQNERNAYVQERIAEVERQITEIKALDEKKAKLLARKDVIEQLQASRSQMVHLFDSLVRTIPDGVVLTAVKQDDQVLTLQGRSQSNARVSTYLRSLENSGWMTQPELSIIEAKGTDKGLPYEFSLQVRLANPNGTAEGIGADAVATPPADPAAPAAAQPAPATGPAPAAAPQAAPAAPPAGESPSLEGAAS
ncbi:PilN domain-containing protein [Cognatilysobacter bugurensis]|uniref:Fimbrial protein n=1 Tax=Cognatilysobacter bugurensis TaxID=543356 RepID=A0A918T511_9GAMM|nr:PilN domain-containing protein [Lysobacter bugurensis]GHA84722.1 fimbrial protein [Lysobacter bugurensis]